MDIKGWRLLLIRAVSLLVLFLVMGAVLSFGRQDAAEEPAKQKADALGTPVVAKKVSNIERIPEQRFYGGRNERPGEICIEVARNASGSAVRAKLYSDAMKEKLILTLEGDKELWRQEKKLSVRHWVKNTSYQGSRTESKDPVVRQRDKSDSGKRTLVFQLDGVYDAVLYETEYAWFIVLQKPWEVYDHIVVIDAGHGGNDEGTVSADWFNLEKEYSLQITSYLKEILDGTTIKAYYTRLDDRYVSKKDRIRLANKVHADLMVSIHCNASEARTANGVEALYSGRTTGIHGRTSSRVLADNLLEQVCKHTGRRKRKTIKRDDLYLMNHAQIPVAFIEVGYMTNASDMKYLQQQEHLRSVARGIYVGIVTSL